MYFLQTCLKYVNFLIEYAKEKLNMITGIPADRLSVIVSVRGKYP